MGNHLGRGDAREVRGGPGTVTLGAAPAGSLRCIKTRARGGDRPARPFGFLIVIKPDAAGAQDDVASIQTNSFNPETKPS